MTSILLGLSGKKRSGKDTVANCEVFKDYKKIAFADVLKTICGSAFSMNFEIESEKDQLFEEPFITEKINVIDLLSGISEYCYIDKSNSKEIMKDLLNKQFDNKREILQYIGTNIIRKYVSDDFFLDVLIMKISSLRKNNPGVNIIVTDARFPNERKMIRKMGGQVLLVKRENIQNTDTTDTHISENSLGQDTDYDYVVYNYGTLEELQNTVKCLF